MVLTHTAWTSTLRWCVLVLCIGSVISADCGACPIAQCTLCSCPLGTYGPAGGPDGTGNVACTSCPAGKYAKEYSWTLRGVFECLDDPEIRMYEGSSDNPGTDNDSIIAACARACLAQKNPLNGVSWVRFRRVHCIPPHDTSAMQGPVCFPSVHAHEEAKNREIASEASEGSDFDSGFLT